MSSSSRWLEIMHSRHSGNYPTNGFVRTNSLAYLVAPSDVRRGNGERWSRLLDLWSPFSKYLDRFQAHCGASPAGSYQSHKVNTKLLV
jgi:hypothetical protein